MSALVPHSVEVAYFWAALVTLVAVGCALTRGAVRTYRAGGAHTAEEHCLTKATRPLPERKSTPIARSSVVWVHVLTSLVANLTSLVVVVLVARPDAADLPAGFGPPAAGLDRPARPGRKRRAVRARRRRLGRQPSDQGRDHDVRSGPAARTRRGNRRHRAEHHPAPGHHRGRGRR